MDARDLVERWRADAEKLSEYDDDRGAAICARHADQLASLLDGEPQPTGGTVGPLADLTVEQVADAIGRAPSTVRGWLQTGALDGYKLNGRDWRVGRGSLRAYQDAQRVSPPVAPPAGSDPRSSSLSDWRYAAGGRMRATRRSGRKRP